MSLNKVTSERWQKAQEFEFDEWKDNTALLESEWQELVKKYTTLLLQIARETGLHADSRILDVGSMSTVPARLLGTGKITALEPLAERLGITGKEKTPAVTMVAAKAEQMPFEDRTFDFIICRNVIDHTQIPDQIMREMHRVLKSGGYLLLMCYVYAPFITLLKNSSERFNILRNVGHPHTFTPGTLDALADRYFSIVNRYIVHTGHHSTDYGKADRIAPDTSPINKTLTWINEHLLGSRWFLKEYGYLARKI